MLHNLRPNRLTKAKYFVQFRPPAHANAKTSCDNLHYYAIQITASQFLYKLCAMLPIHMCLTEL